MLVGGVDSLCSSVLYGFNSLELLSSQACRPFDQHRDGISIGEAAGFAILTKKQLAPKAEFALIGYGESSDAYHMSHPHPDGKGAISEYIYHVSECRFLLRKTQSCFLRRDSVVRGAAVNYCVRLI